MLRIMALTVKRSDLFPVGTAVKAYPSINRHYNGVKPSGAATEEATVDATGTLAFAGLAAGEWVLSASVGSELRNLYAGNQTWTAPPVGLIERIDAVRAEVGA